MFISAKQSTMSEFFEFPQKQLINISVSIVEILPRRTFVRRRSAFGDSASFLAPLSVFYFEIFLSIAANALAAASPTAAYANAITPLLTVRISPKGITATVLASTIPITPCDSAA